MRVIYKLFSLNLPLVILAGCASEPVAEPLPSPVLPTATMSTELDPADFVDTDFMKYDVVVLPAAGVTRSVDGTVVYMGDGAGWEPVVEDQVFEDGDRLAIEEGAQLTISYGSSGALELQATAVKRWFQVKVRTDNVYVIEGTDSPETE
ncbi:MAG: hypothetical protein ACR2P6_01325 [Gammaproteobacteria bacterium]